MNNNKSVQEKVVTTSSLRAILEKLYDWLPFVKTKDSLMLITDNGTADGKKVLNVTKEGVYLYNENEGSGELSELRLNDAAIEQMTSQEIDQIIGAATVPDLKQYVK